LTLSIIIVNYNVTFFLEQCLYSLQRATTNLQAEVIVVDNGSAGDSITYLRAQFPQVCFIENNTNIGFAKACNKGWQQATGRYVLFLNPDTIIAEDTLETCLRFFETHADAGAVGVRMIDGTGTFLKESKRSFPAPLPSFFKLAGLARLFPRSPLFARYHLGHLDARRNHEADVLAGAFIMIPQNVLNEVGGFDETFFMYGEDVDLSYRIQKRGYKNYYLADTEIIHFKGESTKRGSLNYVRLFYSAMGTFVKKWHGGSRAALFNASIHLAIWVRGLMSAAAKVFSRIGLAVIDALLFLTSFWGVKEIWEGTVKPQHTYSDTLLLVLFPLYTLVYLVVAYYAGLYDKQYKRANLLRSGLIATLVLLALYALLPEQYRFSRGILVIGALLAFAGMVVLRRVLAQWGFIKAVPDSATPHILVAGSPKEYDEMEKLLQHKGVSSIIGRLAIAEDGQSKIGLLAQASQIAAALGAQELVLCSGTATNKYLISFIQTLKPGLRLRFHAAGSGSIVGSDSSTASGETITAAAVFNNASPLNRRLKRLVDVSTACLFLLFFPLAFILLKQPLYFIRLAMLVLIGKKTWIGYATAAPQLPPLRPAVLTPEGLPVHDVLKKLDEHHALVDYWYARNYEPLQDLKRLLKNYRQLGRCG
jgi:GT2 family glycosyltransferase